MMVVAKLTLSTSSKVLKHTLEVAMVSREKHHGIEFTRIYIYIYIYIYNNAAACQCNQYRYVAHNIFMSSF